MPRNPRFQDFPLGPRRAGTPVNRWLFEELRAAILTGRLRPGMRLPSTRSLAAQQRIARATVVEAFDQLRAEGYLVGQPGSGTVVSRELPEKFVRALPPLATTPGRGAPRREPARAVRPRAFIFSEPGLDVFPLRVWAQLAARRLRLSGPALLAPGEPGGYAPLRSAIADYLAGARSVRCEAAQVVIVSGTQQALDLVARLTLSRGDEVWLENPGYRGARAAFQQTGARVVPVSVDAAGLNVPAAIARAPIPRLVYVTPAHQFPLGVVLSLERRLALLQEAQRRRFWIFEDDYDGEFRYDSRPLGALQGQDPHGRVIYAGSFNKLLFPSLRLGYVVLPPALVDSFLALRAAVDRFPPTLEQAVLADFFTEGHFERHIRHSRARYLERREAMLAAAGRHLAGLLELPRCEAGFHLLGWLPKTVSDLAVEAAAAAQELAVEPLSRHYLDRPRSGLLLGFSGVKPSLAKPAIERLARVLQGFVRS